MCGKKKAKKKGEKKGGKTKKRRKKSEKKVCYLYRDNLEAICGILKDESNEINLADYILVSSIEVRKIKMY